MNRDVVLLHQTPKRARFYYAGLERMDLPRFKEMLKTVEGVKGVRLNPGTSSVIVTFDDRSTETRVAAFLKERPLQELQSTDAGRCQSDPSRSGIYRSVGATVAAQLLPFESAKLAISTVAALPLLKDGMGELLERGLTSRVLESSAVAVSLARRDYLAANGTNAMLELGEYIEESTVHRSDDLIRELAKPSVDKVWIEKEHGGEKRQQRIDARKLNVGDIVVINAGDTIAVDGHVISGTAQVNQVSMTGEAKPVKKSRGERVISGTVVEEGSIRVWAEQVGADTATERIKTYITSALDEKSQTGLKASRLADKLVPMTLGLAATSYLISRDFENVASVLQADYSCALKLATPVAFKSAISKAGKEGIMIKGATALENLSEVDTVVFDKTGTLTRGELEVVSINSFDPAWNKQDILNLTASAEEHYFHPVAEAVVKAAQDMGFVHMHHEEVEFIVAHGVKTSVEGKEVVIGSRHFLEDDEGIDFGRYKEQIESCLMEGKTVLYVGYDKQLLGTIGMYDGVRENAKAVLQGLKAAGIRETVMLTGDEKIKARQIADEVGIDRVHSDMLPTQKAEVVKRLQSKGKRVAFVGDGINDAPALMQADVGISMYKGADIAKATADIGLLKDDIEAVLQVRQMADATMKLVERNLKATVGVNSAILLGAAAGKLSPLATATLHNGTTIALLLHSIRGVRPPQQL